MVDGKERTVFNSEGRPIHPTVEGVRNFWRWFDSKVVDSQGRPLTVYHATNNDFDAFDIARASGIAGAGIYTTDKAPADDKYGVSVMPLYMSVQNPADMRGGDGMISDIAEGVGLKRITSLRSIPEIKEWSKALREKLIVKGYDGAIMTGENGETYYVAFSPSQIKSATGNYGRFDPSNPDIREQKPSSTTKPPKTGRLRTDRVLKALSGLVPDLTIVAPKTEAEYAAAVEQVVDGAGSSWGMYDFNTKTLFINPAAPDLRQTFFHETAHPVIAALIDGNPEMFLKFYDEVIVEQGGKYEKYSEEQYADKDPLARAEEALAEFMGDIASGNVKVSLDPKSAWQRFKEFLQDLLAKLGWDMREVDLSKPQNVRQFAAEFARAVNKGIKITGLNPTVRGQAAMQNDPVRRRLENELAAARKAVAAAEKDINKRGQSLFGDALDSDGQMIVGDAFDNSQENYNRIMAPLNARVEKAKADLEAYDRNKAQRDSAQGALFQLPDVTKIVNLFKSKGYTAAQAKEYMEGFDPPVSKAVISAVVKGMGGVKSAPKKVQSNTNKAAGVTKPKTKVTVNVATALKDQIRLEARAAREAKKDVSAKRKDFAERISEMIKNDLFGRIAPRQTNALITAAAKTNPDSPKAVDRFFAYAKRVISDANYAENLGNARDARNKARSLKGKKTIPANLKYVLARMAAVDVRLLEDPAEFAAMAEEFLASFKKPGTDQYNMASADAMNKYMDKLEKQLDKAAADEAMERGAEDISGIDGLDPDDVMKAMMSEDPEAELTKLLKDLDRRKEDELHDKMVAAANASRIDLKDMDTSAMTPKEKRAYKALVEADLQAMSIKDLASYIFGVDNLVVNESFDGIHSIAVAAAATKIVPEIGRLNEAAGFRTKWPIGRWDEGVRNAFRQMFYGLPNIVTRIAGFTKAAAKLSELVGIADIQKGRAMAEKIKHEEDVAFAKVLNEQIKKGRRNGRNVSGPKAVAAEGVIAYLVQRFDGVSDEESFKRRKDILEEDINKNAKDSPKTYKYIQQAFDEFVKDAKTAKEARDKFKAAMPENDVILQHMIDMQAKYADVIMEHNAMYRNQIDSKLQDYLPISYVMSRSASDDAKAQAKQKGDGGYKQDYSAFTRGLVNPRQAGHMKSRGQNKRLPENRRIDYNIRRNSLTTLAENLYDVYTTEHWMRARAVLRANGIDEALGSKDNTTALDNALADVYNSHTSDIVDDKMGGRYADYVAKKVKSAASFWGLAGAGQVLQQASDQMTNALLMSMTKDGGKSYGLSFMDVVQMAAGKNQDLKELLSMGAIGRRADTLSGTRWTKDMESQMGVLQSQIQRSAPLHALADIHRSMVRIFFTPLKETDNAMATSAWVMFYRQYLADNGIKRIGNWKDEVDLLKADDKLRREAFAHAEQQTNMTQGPSDPALFGAWARRDRSGWLNFVRAVLNPFGGFPSTVRGRFANAASEIGAYTIPAISDKKARERLAGAARVFASTVVSQGAFQYMRYKMAVALFPTLGAGLANMVRYFFDDEEDEVVAMSKLYVAMEIANTIGMMDRDFTRVVREANKQVRERNLLTPALYDEDAIMRKKAAENWKFSFTQFGIDMTVGGFSQYMDKEAVNGVNKAYWFMMGPVLQQPEMMQTDGTVIPYAKWKRDIVNMPFALPGYWDESTSYGLFSIPGSRMSRLMDAASRTGMPSDDERRDTQKRFKYQQRADDARSMRTQIQMRRAAKTDQEIEAADKAFEDWMRTQDPSRFERLSRTYLEQVIMPYDNSLGNILQAENDPIVRARTYHSATRNMSKEEKKKIDQSVQAVGVFDDAFMQELNRLQKEEAAKK
jgi:hypothetical protein